MSEKTKSRRTGQLKSTIWKVTKTREKKKRTTVSHIKFSKKKKRALKKKKAASKGGGRSEEIGKTPTTMLGSNLGQTR